MSPWKGKSDREIQTDGLHAVITTPVVIGDYIYGMWEDGDVIVRRDSPLRSIKD